MTTVIVMSSTSDVEMFICVIDVNLNRKCASSY